MPRPGERVGDRLLVRQRVELRVLAERDAEPGDDEQQRRGREADGEDVDAGEVVEHEDRRSRTSAQTAGTARSGRPSISSVALAPGVDPCGAGDEQRRRRPEDVDRAPRLIRGHLEQEDRVGDRRREEPEPEHEPAPLEPPAGEREDAEHRREEQDVAERVGEVRRDGAPRALGRAEHDLDEDRCAEARPPRRTR